MSLENILGRFADSVTSAQNSIIVAHQNQANGSPFFDSTQQHFLTEAAFVKIFVSWETFLEETFCHYLSGDLSLSGKSIGRLFIPTSAEHLNNLLMRFVNTRFFDWSVPDNVRQIANIVFFKNNPFDVAISSNITDLQDLKTIRNSAVHLSSSTSQQLDGLGLRKLNRPCTNICAYDLLLAIDPNSPTRDTILLSYIKTLNTICNLLCRF